MFQQISDLIGRYRVYLITAHERLDGDALGSELALYHMLRQMGKEATIYNQDGTPENYQFLAGSDRITHELPPLEAFDAAFILDCSELERVGKEAEKIAAIPHLVNIDHHYSNGGFCETRLIDPLASSTGELICRLLAHMGFAATGEMATCLYTAILTDTGGFRYGNTGRESLRAAADLVVCGASPQWISENVYEAYAPAKIRLLAAVLPTLILEEGGRVGSLTITQRALETAGASHDHAEGFVDFPRSIRGVKISILYAELPDGRFKLSLRSKGNVNVAQIAGVFGGGGHINAAACRMKGKIDAIHRRMLEAIRTSGEL
jgi:phosphoesterase RecJ-like protein